MVKATNNRSLQRSKRSQVSIVHSMVSKVQDPRVIVKSAIGNPKSTTFGRRWQARRVQVLYNSTSANTFTVCLNDLINLSGVSGVTTNRPLASDYTSGLPVKILGMRVWNNSLGQDIKADFDADVTTVGSSSQSVQGTDTGTGTSLAGVSFRVPQVLAQTLTLGSTATVATLACFGTPTVSPSAPFRVTCEYTLLMQI